MEDRTCKLVTITIAITTNCTPFCWYAKFFTSYAFQQQYDLLIFSQSTPERARLNFQLIFTKIPEIHLCSASYLTMLLLNQSYNYNVPPNRGKSGKGCLKWRASKYKNKTTKYNNLRIKVYKSLVKTGNSH
jgi:hypothetical protein